MYNALLILGAILVLVSIYFIVSEGDPNRTKRILGLEKVDFEYKHNLISKLHGVNIILIAGIAFLLHFLLPVGAVQGIVWMAVMAVYLLTVSYCVRKFVINNKRFKGI